MENKENLKPGLFGIKRSNRDYSLKDAWGKNQFNSSFPASLACYLYFKNLKPVYYRTDKDMNRVLDYIGVDELFRTSPLGEDIYFAFETGYLPFQKYLTGTIPRNDLVIMSNDECLTSLEIKLVALPDNATCGLEEKLFGAEIVIRPDTIIYLACTFINCYCGDRKKIRNIINGVGDEIQDWTIAENVLSIVYDIYLVIKRLVENSYEKQVPVVMEPVWKTEGKSPILSENCLDVFVWSNCAILKLFVPSEEDFVSEKCGVKTLHKISRHTRTMIWLFKMIKDYVENGTFNGKSIIDELSYNTKNDKAFATNGSRTHTIMTCEELTKPRISKNEIKNIILGGGQNLLSPERRFDAIIFNSPDLFTEDI